LLSLAGYIRSRVCAARGEFDAAIECARRAVDLSRDPIAWFTAVRALCDCQAEAGDAHGAIETFERMTEHRGRFPTQHAYVGALCSVGEAYVLVDDLGRAESAAHESLDLNGGANPFHSALAWRVLGRVAMARGQAEGARSYLEQALGAFRQCDAAFEAARTDVDLAMLLLGQSDRDGSASHVDVAVGLFEKCGVPGRVASVASLLSRRKRA